MPRSHAYPPDLARYVEANWPTEAKLTLPSGLLEEAFGGRVSGVAHVRRDAGRRAFGCC